MRLYIVGFGVLGMFTMGCGVMRTSVAPPTVGTTEVTAAELSSAVVADPSATAPRVEKTPLDRADPWDGTEITPLAKPALDRDVFSE